MQSGITTAGREFDQYDSLAELVEHVTTTPQTLRGSAYGFKEPESFTLTESMAAAVALWRDGWHGVRSQVDGMAGPIVNQLRPQLADNILLEHRQWGGAVNIDRYLMAEPDCMVAPILAPSTRHGRVCRILMNSGVMGDVNADTILKRGAALLALVELLRQSGLSAEIWMEGSVTQGHSVLVRVLEAGQPIDIDTLMFPLAHPSMHRRFIFAARNRATGSKSRSMVGMGNTDLVRCEEIVDPDVTINAGLGMRGGDVITKDPEAWVLGELRRLGLLLD